MNPLFSIIIPCYNQAHFLSDCLASLLQQSFTDWEAIVVNDGSTDTTSEVAKEYQKKDARVKLVVQENGGLSSARNFGIKSAQGNRFIFLDADDFLYPKALGEIEKMTKLCDDFDLIQFGYTHIKEDGKTILTHAKVKYFENLIPAIFHVNIGPCHSFCISRNLIGSIGRFDEGLKSVEDWDFWIRAAKAGAKHKVISAELVYYRYIPNSMSRNPVLMYESLSEVNTRAVKKDNRIVVISEWNKDYTIEVAPLLKFQLLRCLGVSLMQRQVEKSINWFNQENTKRDWKIQFVDFEQMNSYLSFKYFLDANDINYLLKEIKPNFILFFKGLGYNNNDITKIIKIVFGPQLKKQNHLKFGKYLGAILNRLHFY